MPTRRAFAKTLGVAVATVLASALQAAETEPQPSDLPSPTADETSRLAELDAYWARVSRAVKEGDFELYVSTCLCLAKTPSLFHGKDLCRLR